MNKNEDSLKTFKTLSRVQTAKIRQNLERTFYNIKNKKNSRLKLNIENDNNKRPLTSYHNEKLSQLYLPPKEIKTDNQIILIGKEEYQKAHLNEVNIQNLFTEKLWEKNNIEKSEDYTKKIAYKKLIMRARLLKAMKTNIVLKKKDFDEYNNKYYKGMKLLSNKLKKNKYKINNDSNESNEDINNINNIPNFISIKNPDIFSQYEYTSLFQDFFCTPLELIKKIFNYDEQKIIKLDPIFFRFNREPFLGLQKNMGFSLKEKINEEDKIALQKIEKIKEINKRFYYLKKKHNTKREKKENLKKISEEKKSNNNYIIKPKTKSEFYFPNNDKINRKKKSVYNFSPFSSKGKDIKKRNKSEKNSPKKKDINFYSNMNYNIYFEMKKNQRKKKKNININNIYNDEEKIKDKKKRLTFEEIFEMYKERKKLYLDDMSYNRKKNKFRFAQLRIKKNEENLKENRQKENLRKLLTEIEDNYKIYQK